MESFIESFIENLMRQVWGSAWYRGHLLQQNITTARNLPRRWCYCRTPYNIISDNTVLTSKITADTIA